MAYPTIDAINTLNSIEYELILATENKARALRVATPMMLNIRRRGLFVREELVRPGNFAVRQLYGDELYQVLTRTVFNSLYQVSS